MPTAKVLLCWIFDEGCKKFTTQSSEDSTTQCSVCHLESAELAFQARSSRISSVRPANFREGRRETISVIKVCFFSVLFFFLSLFCPGERVYANFNFHMYMPPGLRWVLRTTNELKKRATNRLAQSLPSPFFFITQLL